MIFLDSNIVLYALGEEVEKRKIAHDLLISYPYISTQELWMY